MAILGAVLFLVVLYFAKDTTRRDRGEQPRDRKGRFGEYEE